MTNLHTRKNLTDYQQPDFLINTVNLEFNIRQQDVLVISTTDYFRPAYSQSNKLVIHGSSKLLQVKLDGNIYDDYQLLDEELTINNVPEKFTLTIISEVDAFNNKSCMGLYASNGNLFTQCEPEGFRKITYYPDRPDVMAVFTTTIIADQEQYPVILSNGNKITEEILANGQVKVVWQDPFKKPSYLFALVAGKFSQINDTFITQSGKTVSVEVYSEPESISQCQHCLESAKRAMKWDEQRFNLEYDLDRYMIVASGDFNMGAMENKGLNIFNTKYVMADSKTATDNDFMNVEAVVGHEYFHNWTGNRVTCRDWFQLSLKEGLTVFRDQEFSSDLHSRPVERINNVKVLRQAQFAEDASPLAHPVRPASYLEINNFYTVTVYEKGSEVVRMYQTILGLEGFRQGMELYFARHDGSAVTCDEFCNAMAEANQVNLSQFMRWYSQAGTPRLIISDEFSPENEEYRLTIKQTTNPTPGQEQKLPLLIPFKFGLLSAEGNELPIEALTGQIFRKDDSGAILLLSKDEETFTFKTTTKPTPSLLRDFSAPVIVEYDYSVEHLINLAANDGNSFNRWEALQTLYKMVISDFYNQRTNQQLATQLVAALANAIESLPDDPEMLSLLLTLPSFAELSTSFKPTEVKLLVAAINQLQALIANQLLPKWEHLFATMVSGSYNFNDAGKRALKNTALSYLIASDNQQNYLNAAKNQYLLADNLTDKIAVLATLNNRDLPLREELLQVFAKEFATYPLVMDKWFMLQSQSQLPLTTITVGKLIEHPQFDKSNPNKLYSLIRAFTANPLHFNSAAGYRLIADEILRIDQFNPSVAGRIAHGFSAVTCLAEPYQQQALPVLQQIVQTQGLSNDVYELISKTIAQIQTP